jgi:UDP-N-acetylmuramoylalanine--D-glutamate ligase
MTYQGKKILIVGLGVSGKSATQFLLKRGAHVVGYDAKCAKRIEDQEIIHLKSKGLQVAQDLESIKVEDFDLVVVSPGIPPTHPLYLSAQKQGIEMIGEIELAARSIHHHCIGITGSNGKTTVTTLVTHVLNSSGICAKSLGNVGTPLTSEIDSYDSQDAIFVIELSSFQLETLNSRILNYAIILNLTPNHLDRHLTMEAYASAKSRIKNCLKDGGKFFTDSHTSKKFSSLIGNCHIYDRDIDVNNYDETNQAAAFALCEPLGITKSQFLTALKTYHKPPHRLEFVDKIDDIHYYDDSKATSIDAVLKAVSTLQGNVILIAGGLDKGAPYTPWISAFAGKVKTIFAIGEAAPKIVRDMDQKVPVIVCHSLADAVLCSSKEAKPGDNILLSPGCASYDMFRDYKHRGEEFKRLVKNLKTQNAG